MSDKNPEKSFEFHQKGVMSKLETLEKLVKKAQSELDFQPEKAGWDQARAMNKVRNEVSKFTEKLSEIGQKDYFVDRAAYKASIDKNMDNFYKSGVDREGLDKPLKESIEKQHTIMGRSHPGNFHRLRKTAVSILEKQNPDIAKKFEQAMDVPNVKAKVQSKEKDKGSSKEMSR